MKPREISWIWFDEVAEINQAAWDRVATYMAARERQKMYDGLQEKYGFIPMNHQEPVFFPVDQGAIFDQRGAFIPGYKRIFRGDSGDTLAVHTDSYSMVPYEKHFSMFEAAIRKSEQLRDQECVIGTDMTANGARIFRQYLFPNLKADIPARNKREIAFRIVCFDSYDGSSAYIGKSGYFDFACANTSFFGTTTGDFRFKHTGDMEAKVQVAADSLTNLALDFDLQAERCKQWTGVRLLAEEVERIVSKLPQGNKGLTDHLVASWAKEGDNTLWGVHQALTKWSSRDVPMRTSCDRAKRVTTLVEGRDWKMLEPV